jgi:hypothetical protein
MNSCVTVTRARKPLISALTSVCFSGQNAPAPPSGAIVRSAPSDCSALPVAFVSDGVLPVVSGGWTVGVTVGNGGFVVAIAGDGGNAISDMAIIKAMPAIASETAVYVRFIFVLSFEGGR